jgi:type 1 glutamine amidotransferase
MIRAFSLLATLVWVMWSIAPPESAHIVFMIGEDEYQTWNTLPEFAERDLKPLGYRVTIVKADEAEKNNFPGLVDALRTADLLFVSVRRRTPRTEQLEAVRAHLAAGKPLAGIRTASHAFALRPSDPPAGPGHSTWQTFDPEVLGGHYSNHHPAGPSTTVAVASGADMHAILKSMSVRSLVSAGSLYKVSPLEKGATPLLLGTIPGQPAEPIAWTNEYGPKRARIFYTSFGHPDDFKNTEFRRLLTNAIAWAVHANH